MLSALTKLQRAQAASAPLGVLPAAWPGLAGLVVLAAPLAPTLGEQVWSRESGAHGPIVLATGAWLLWRQRAALQAHARPGSPWGIAFLLLLAAPLYVLGRMLDLITLSSAGVYLTGVAVLYAEFGGAALARNWFPLVYLGFAVPPPNWLMEQITAPLKTFVSAAATATLQLAGLPVAREGVTISLPNYKLLVEDACSGMNSLIGLTAVGLLYIHLLRGSCLRYSALLTAFVLPIAVAGNIARVMILILVTYFLGDQAAQGFLHYTAGLVLFCIALLLVFALDILLWRIAPRWWRAA